MFLFWLIIVCPLVFIWLSSSTTTTAKSTITACTNESDTDKAKCVEDTIAQIQNTWLKSCILHNIDNKKQLANTMKGTAWSSLSNADIVDIDGVVKECMLYADSTPNHVSVWYPVFQSFVSSMAGSFVGNYLGSSRYSNINNYNRSEEEKKSSWSYGGVTSRGLSSTNDTYKSNSRNIAQMKSASATTSNYSLGDTGKSWISSSSRRSSSSSWSSSSSSRSSLGSSSMG
jgi:hypothetical protein